MYSYPANAFCLSNSITQNQKRKIVCDLSPNARDFRRIRQILGFVNGAGLRNISTLTA